MKVQYEHFSGDIIQNSPSQIQQFRGGESGIEERIPEGMRKIFNIVDQTAQKQ